MLNRTGGGGDVSNGIKNSQSIQLPLRVPEPPTGDAAAGKKPKPGPSRRQLNALLRNYEGTNGIQAMDLVGRKLLDEGKIAFKILDEINQTVKQAMSQGHSDLIEMGKKVEHNSMIYRNTLDWMLSKKSTNDRYGGSMPFLRATGYLLGGHYLLKAAISSSDNKWRALSKFYIYNILERAAMNSKISCCEPESLYDFDNKMFGS